MRMIRGSKYSIGLVLVLILTAVAGCITPYAGQDRALKARLDEILTRLDDTGATVTARVVDLESGRALYARDVDVPFTPASNMKIPVSATGLDCFGAEHTFKTYLAIDGDDLWVIGTGDPGIGDGRLAKRSGSTSVGVFDKWADKLAELGIRRIEGNLYFYEGALDDEWIHPSWVSEDLLHWYATPTTGLNFNDNCVDITVFPTEAGQPVRYEVMPPVQNITVMNECVTADEQDPNIAKLPEGNVYRLYGTCNKQTALKSKPVVDPGAFFCDALRTHLASRGIAIGGEIRRAAQPLGGRVVPPDEKIVAVHATNMRDIIGRINTNSQNFFAEALCKLTGQAYAAMQGRQVPGSWAEGELAMRVFLRRNGIDDSKFVVADGSGLSHLNKVTSHMLTDIFITMYARPDREIYIGSLAKGGVDGTLKKRYAGLQGHVFAKTGYIETVRSLSGYVKTFEGKWLTFSILYNNIPDSVKPYEALQDEAVKLLMRWPNLEEEAED